MDDQDLASTSYEGAWKDFQNGNAVGGFFSYAPSGTSADKFTWEARVPSAGDYLVEGHYFAASYRGKPSVWITGYPAPAFTTTWNQTVGSASGDWAPLNPQNLVRTEPGKTARVVIQRDTSAATTPIADAVRWTEFSTQTKAAGDRDGRHSFALGSLVQQWVKTRYPTTA